MPRETHEPLEQSVLPSVHRKSSTPTRSASGLVAVTVNGSEALAFTNPFGEVIVTLGALAFTVQLWAAGVASVFPAGSVARTRNVCGPSASGPAYVCGLAQDWKPAVSSSHSKLEPASEELNWKVGELSFEGSGGAESTDVPGAAESIVHPKLAGVVSVFAAGSVARTRKVCGPSPTGPAYVWGLVQGWKPAPSSSHSKVEPASLAEKANVGDVSFDGLPGWLVIVVSGALRSIVQVYEAGVASVLPAASVARTSKVCEPALRPE
jgi:hypothetical protein